MKLSLSITAAVTIGLPSAIHSLVPDCGTARTASHRQLGSKVLSVMTLHCGRGSFVCGPKRSRSITRRAPTSLRIRLLLRLRTGLQDGGTCTFGHDIMISSCWKVAPW